MHEELSQPRTDKLFDSNSVSGDPFNSVYFQDNLFKDAMEYAAESKNAEVAEVRSVCLPMT